MKTVDTLSLLSQVGAIITNSHIVYTSGRHGSSYVNKDALFPYTTETSHVCLDLAQNFVDAGVQVVAGPTIGGVIMAQWVAYHLLHLTGEPTLSVYAEEQIDHGQRQRVFRRGYDNLVSGKRVLVVEDVLTTGGSARKVVHAVRECGGMVVGLGALCNRGGLTAENLDVPRFVALVELSLESWDESDCPLCQQGIPITNQVGKGARK
jgi:orotate phosphoribosyltransferase